MNPDDREFESHWRRVTGRHLVDQSCACCGEADAAYSFERAGYYCLPCYSGECSECWRCPECGGTRAQHRDWEAGTC